MTSTIVAEQDGSIPRVMAVGHVRGLPLPLTVREATWGDYTAIMDIGAVQASYDAGDYLYGKLARYLNDPERTCYVAVYQDKVVAFVMTQIFESSGYFVARLARVIPDFQNTGCWNFLRTAITVDTWRRHPSVDVNIGCTSGYKKLAVYQDTSNIQMIRNYMNIHVTNGVPLASFHAVKNMINLPPNVIVEPMTTTVLYDVLSNRTSAWRMFPHGYVIIAREPISIRREDYHRITTECSHIRCSRDVTSGDVLTISFGSGFVSRDGYVYDVDMYTETGNTSEMARHVLKHLEMATKHVVGEQKLAMTIFLSQKFELAGVKQILLGKCSLENMFNISDIFQHTMVRVHNSDWVKRSGKSSAKL